MVGALLLFGVVWVVIRNRDGQEVARVAVPPGGTVTVQPTPPTKPPVVKASATAPTVDLLKTIPDDLFRRFWVKNANGGITGECRTPGIDVPLPIPVTPPDEYDLDLTVARQGGALELQVGLAVGGVPCALVLQKPADGPAIAGLSLVAFNPVDIPANPTHTPRPDWFTSEQPQTLRVEVRKQLVKVTTDGKSLFEWQPKMGALSAPRDIRPPLPQGVLFVRAKSSKQPGRWDVQRLTLTPRTSAVKQVQLPPLFFERRAAEWALANGAKITIQAPEAQAQHVITITRVDALPNSPFYVTTIVSGTTPSAIAAFSDTGVRVLLELERLDSISLDGAPLTSEGACCLATISSLRKVRLPFCGKIGDEGGEMIARLPELVELNLWGGSFGDRTCSSLQSATKIESLDIWAKTITNTGLVHLTRMPALRRLMVGNSGATESLAHLSGLNGGSQLKYLQLQGPIASRSSFDRLKQALPDCKIKWRLQALSDARIEARSADHSEIGAILIREIATGRIVDHSADKNDSDYHLIELDFNGFKKRWNDLRCTSNLADMIELETLLFDDTAVTDESIPVLEKLINLKRLSLRGTGVTPEGIERLKKALPKCQVDGGPLPATPDKPADAK
ncbi:MAG: hypothetical protein JNM18_00735 [Planctomycetaceae bacterium]|nr:hypothetical protein [Planctomycetaceae bacterium]